MIIKKQLFLPNFKVLLPEDLIAAKKVYKAMYINNCMNCVSIPGNRPAAQAKVSGSKEYPDLNGTVSFYQTGQGMLVAAEIFGLPDSTAVCQNPVFGFHIHNGGSCTGNETDPFADALTHYNPQDCPHPYHAGDLPPLFGNDGYAFMIVLTNRITVHEIIGKTVIIHDKPDDFTSQPAGNSGNKIGCGIIERLRR